MKLTPKTIFLLLTILMAALFIWPELNYQDLLSQGDHGRDLYAFDAVTHGKLPYKDFWWVYGPLMPYYYGLFFKVFGVHITSVLLGRALLVILCSVFFYLSAACLMSPGWLFWPLPGLPKAVRNSSLPIIISAVLPRNWSFCWCLLSYIWNGRPCAIYGSRLPLILSWD